MKKLLICLVVVVISLMQASFCLAGEGNTRILKASTVEISTMLTTSDIGGGTSIGYFMNENLEIGGGLLVSNGKLKDDYGDADYTAKGFSLWGRYHFPAAGRSVTFVGLGLGVVEVGIEDYDTKINSLAIEGGLRIFPTDNFSVNIILNYSMSDYEDYDYEYDLDGFNLGVGFSAFIL